jgi:dienelactone hydrolase
MVKCRYHILVQSKYRFYLKHQRRGSSPLVLVLSGSMGLAAAAAAAAARIAAILLGVAAAVPEVRPSCIP